MKKTILLTLALMLAGCNGGGGDSATAPIDNTPKQAAVWNDTAWNDATWK